MTDAPGRLVVEAYREALSRGTGTGRLPVVSDSMRPCLQRGDIIEFKTVAPYSLMPGDIVVVMNGMDAGLDVHRLIWRQPVLGRPVRFITKGDALEKLDFAAGPEQVLGKVTAILRGDRRLQPATLADRIRCVWVALQHGVRKLR